ncbi:MAG: adenine phosphoribosyltransferase [Candidatus Dormibacteraeota bacterium]|nr:adenine phosphoribosyltransferase [Candidatus Dormibacteraeota bacterium]
MPRKSLAAPARAAQLAARLAATVRTVPDHPRPGILFRDITTLLADGVAFHDAIDAIASAHADAGVELVAGVESRGFILGGPLAYLLGTGFVPLRKQGQLPSATVAVPYALEYGEAVLEVHADAISHGHRVLIVDDVLATGGTAAAAIQLVEKLGGVVAGLAFLIELEGLGGAAALGGRAHSSLITF